ncbi:non-ribosomal peptide synthetase [Kitasatospora sp. NBC_01560]|uniref:non-ribosomal peptide synthetase n=1 Tax=Kitasatospora sp. NBC_01560 TaxID=2975965 RepID=UPI00386D8450
MPSVSRLFSAAVEAHGARPALLSPYGDLSYRGLDDRVSALADALSAGPVRTGDVVAVEQSPHPDSVAALLAVLRTGGVVLPLDPLLPDARRAAVLEAGRAAGLVTAEGVTQPLPYAAPPGETADATGRGDAAYVTFTSGSTGTPRGILGRGAGLAHFVQWQRDTFGIGPGDRVGQLTSWAFDVALRDILTPLVSGAALCLPESRSLDPDRVREFLSRRAVTVLHTVPSLARRWLAAPNAAGRNADGPKPTDRGAAGPAPTGLRLTFFAGEQLHGELVREWRAQLAPRGRVVNLYGPSETTLAKFWYEVPAEPAPGPQPVGRALPGTRAALSPGGEVVIRTPYRSYGYLDGTEAFRPRRPGDPDDLLHPTGDLGRFDEDGTLHLLGRIDDQVKVRGVRIALREVERVLESVPGVLQAGVVGVRDDRGGLLLVGHVQVGAPGDGADGGPAAPVTRDALRRAVGGRLPAAAVPAVLNLVTDGLPLLPSGKLDRVRLRALTGVPSCAASRARAGGSTDRVTEVCEHVLGFSPLAPDDDLFERGADSLLALEIAARLEDVLGSPVPPGLLFEAPTIAEITERLAVPSPARSAGAP